MSLGFGRRRKVRLVKAMVFPVFMYGCKSWTVKKAECRKIDAFEVWCWRRFLRVPWTARIFNQSILKQISSGCSLEGLMLKLKLQYFGHVMRRVDSLEKTLMLGGIGGRRRRGQQRMRWQSRLNGHGFGWTPGVCDGQGVLACYGSWGHKESDMTEWLNWTEMPLGPLGPLSDRLNKHGLIFSGLEGTESSCTAGETARPGTGN